MTWMLEEEIGVPSPRDYVGEVEALLTSNLAPRLLLDRLSDYHEKDIASAFSRVTAELRKKLYTLFPVEELAHILEYAEEPETYLGEMKPRRRAALLSEMEPLQAVLYLDSLEDGEKESLLALIDREAKEEITLLSSFDDTEIGSRMTTNFVTVRAGSTIKEAMHALVTQASENDNISTLYVLDERELFCGAIDLKDLILARQGDPLDAITVNSYPYLYATEEIADCLPRLFEYAEDSIPVLDAENRMIGVILSEELSDLVSEEMGDDYAKLAGLSAEEELKEPTLTSVKKRLPWLSVLLMLGLLVSGVVGIFESVVQHLSLIVCFQSLILGMAGNAGTQSLAVTIRTLSDEGATGKEKWQHVGKEARISLVNGLLLSLLSFLVVGVYVMLRGHPVPYAASVALCTGLALLASIWIAGIMGTVIPLLFQKLHVDPAVASGPLITTVNDLVAVVSYYGLAWLLLIQIMGL